jgi:hypothetical protein
LKKIVKKSAKESLPLFMHKDVSNLYEHNGVARYAALLAGQIPQSNWSDFTDMTEVHDTGIFGFDKFPQLEV